MFHQSSVSGSTTVSRTSTSTSSTSSMSASTARPFYCPICYGRGDRRELAKNTKAYAEHVRSEHPVASRRLGLCDDSGNVLHEDLHYCSMPSCRVFFVLAIPEQQALHNHCVCMWCPIPADGVRHVYTYPERFLHNVSHHPYECVRADSQSAPFHASQFSRPPLPPPSLPLSTGNMFEALAEPSTPTVETETVSQVVEAVAPAAVPVIQETEPVVPVDSEGFTESVSHKKSRKQRMAQRKMQPVKSSVAPSLPRGFVPPTTAPTVAPPLPPTAAPTVAPRFAYPLPPTVAQHSAYPRPSVFVPSLPPAVAHPTSAPPLPNKESLETQLLQAELREAECRANLLRHRLSIRAPLPPFSSLVLCI